MTQQEYLRARVEERKAEKQPSKQHKQPLVQTDPGSGKPIYRKEE